MDTSQLYSAMGEPNQGSTSSSGGRGKIRSREIETLSLEIRKCPRDLFHSFLTTDPIATQNGHNRPPKSAIEEQREDVEIELNLGLSLGGRFGVDKSHKGLIRASSIAGTVPTFREVEESAAAAAATEAAPARAAALARTSSLPAETEEEWRRRKEMQSLRRMEARRRRSEKQRNMKESSIGGGGEERESGPGLNSKGKLERQQSGQPGKLNPGPGFEAPVGVKGKGGFFGSLQGLLAQQQGYSQGSGESQGGCSSGVSELEGKTHHQGCNDYGSQDPTLVSSSCTKYGEPETSDDKKKGAEAAGGIEDMPCVFTIGDGPNGRKVQGILYRYSRGEEVRIMCVCHGSFFSPAEFVKHAGGRDVDHPLKHIVVNPSPSPF